MTQILQTPECTEAGDQLNNKTPDCMKLVWYPKMYPEI